MYCGMRLVTTTLAVLLAACGGASPGAEGTTAEGETDTAAEAAPTLALPNQREPEEGITTGGHPSESDLRAAAAAGYTAVISLQTDTEDGFAEERALVEELGMSFVSIPVAGGDGVTAENAARLDEVLAGAERPVIVHCASGNRVGALLALRAFAGGASIEEALELGRGAGLTRLEDTVRERLEALCAEDPERSCGEEG